MVTRATQLTNRKLHPVIKETECVFACVCEWFCGCGCTGTCATCCMLCTCVILTTQGRGNSSECTPEVLAEPPLCTGNDGHLQPVCNIHQLMTRMTGPLRANETPVPLWSDRDTDYRGGGMQKWTKINHLEPIFNFNPLQSTCLLFMKFCHLSTWL